MAQTEGEKELVLGNKQLVSFFFVVLALCGVFFSLGYMIGRNSSKAGLASLDGTPPVASTTGERPSQESEPPRETARAETPHTFEPSPSETASSAPVTPPVPMTQPAREVPPVSAPAKMPAAGESTVPEAGATYLQVAAQKRSDADNLVRTLREQNFPAIVADSSRPELFRVLVGPYQKTVDVADAKARLKVLGFANAFVMK
jgi:cell division septation protein DedD